MMSCISSSIANALTGSVKKRPAQRSMVSSRLSGQVGTQKIDFVDISGPACLAAVSRAGLPLSSRLVLEYSTEYRIGYSSARV